jgi:hypothetical protein
MTLTGKTITDAQITDLLHSTDSDEIAATARVALGLPRERHSPIVLESREECREQCAAILNARRVCRACEGDGFLAADSSTPHYERVTRDSRKCGYCDSKGWVAS